MAESSQDRPALARSTVGAVSGEFSFESTLYLWDGPQTWVFAGLPVDLSVVIREVHGDHAAGFGSLRVEVALGGQVWRTSIFPDSKSGTYVLPVKKDVRRKAGVDAGDRVEIDLSVL
jgi:hypothetical protein